MDFLNEELENACCVLADGVQHWVFISVTSSWRPSRTNMNHIMIMLTTDVTDPRMLVNCDCVQARNQLSDDGWGGSYFLKLWTPSLPLPLLRNRPLGSPAHRREDPQPKSNMVHF